MLTRSLPLLQAIVGQSLDGISLADLDGRYVFVNECFCAMTGYGEDELLAMEVADLLPPEQPSTLFPQVAQGQSGIREGTIARKDGQLLPVEVSGTRIHVDGRDFVLGIVRDTTDRRQARDSLEHQRQRLEVLLRVSREINAELDVTAVLRHLVEAALRLTGAQSGAAGLMARGELCFHEYYRAGEVRQVDFHFSEGEGVPGWVMQHRTPYLSNDAAHDPHVMQEVRELLDFSNLLAMPIINRHGDLLGCFNILDKPEGFDEEDIGLLHGLSAHAAVALENAQMLREREQAFRALELSERKYRTLIENASDAIFLANAQTGVLFDANRQAERLIGLPREKIVGMHQSELHPPEDAEMYKEVFRRHVEKGEGFDFQELFVQHSDGRKIPVEISAGVIDIGGRQIIQGVFRDISERKQAEVELKQLNRTLKLISECNQILVRAKNEQELLDDICRQIIEVGGYRMAWVGMALMDEKKRVQPVAQAGFEEGYLHSVSVTWRDDDESGRGAGRAIRTGKTVIFQDIENDPDFAPWREDARKRGYGSAAAFPLCIGEKVIGSLNIYDAKAHAFHGEEVALLQELAADLAYGLDALRHKEEKERLEAQLLQAQKMEAIGTLAGGIAHDFNNILTGMLGNLYLAEKDSKDRPGVLERLKRVEAQGHRAAETVAQLLTFARRGHTRMRPLSLASLIKEHMKLYRASIPENIELRTSVGEGAWMVNGDATQLQQMLLNLLANARHAVEERESPVIEVSLELLDAASDVLLRHTELAGGPFVHLIVRDNGYGIAEVHMAKLFEPFFTTKASGKGTGLGLAMVYGIVQSHGGAIEVDSREGKGTSVHVYFPLIESSQKSTRTEDSGEMAAGHGETVLLVDDDPDVRQTIEEVLSSLGYHVLVACDGEEGWETFEAHKGEVKLAVLDVVMPRMSGPKLARKIRDTQPHIPILFQSGYGEEDMLSEISQMQDCRFLSKPVQITELSHNVRQMLQEAQ